MMRTGTSLSSTIREVWQIFWGSQVDTSRTAVGTCERRSSSDEDALMLNHGTSWEPFRPLT